MTIYEFTKAGGSQYLQLDSISGAYVEQRIHGVEELGNVEVDVIVSTFRIHNEETNENVIDDYLLKTGWTEFKGKIEVGTKIELRKEGTTGTVTRIWNAVFKNEQTGRSETLPSLDLTTKDKRTFTYSLRYVRQALDSGRWSL